MDPVAQQHAGDGDAEAPPPGGPATPKGPWRRWAHLSIRLTEGAQDLVAGAVGLTLIVLAAGILVTSVVDFFKNLPHESLNFDATDLLDSLLLVLILVEIVHTVVISLRSHTLAPQPFLVVGLIAVIRSILLALSSHRNVNTTQMGLYIGMVAVFVASLVAMQLLGARRRSSRSDEMGQNTLPPDL